MLSPALAAPVRRASDAEVEAGGGGGLLSLVRLTAKAASSATGKRGQECQRRTTCVLASAPLADGRASAVQLASDAWFPSPDLPDGKTSACRRGTARARAALVRPARARAARARIASRGGAPGRRFMITEHPRGAPCHPAFARGVAGNTARLPQVLWGERQQRWERFTRATYCTRGVARCTGYHAEG